MSCSNCKSEIRNDECGCGTSTCKPFSIPPNCYHCPPPPTIPPCDYRVCDGEKIPVWHSTHPLIPMFRFCYSTAIDPTCCEEQVDKQLGCLLGMAEGLFSTCQFSDGEAGGKYHQAIMLKAAATIDLSRRMTIWESAWSATIMLGKSFSSPIPTIENGIYGQMLKDLVTSAPGGDVCLVI